MSDNRQTSVAEGVMQFHYDNKAYDAENSTSSNLSEVTTKEEAKAEVLPRHGR